MDLIKFFILYPRYERGRGAREEGAFAFALILLLLEIPPPLPSSGFSGGKGGDFKTQQSRA